jgi:hypothetical protein
MPMSNFGDAVVDEQQQAPALMTPLPSSYHCFVHMNGHYEVEWV